MALSYNSFGHNASLINKSYNFYENATYIQTEDYSEIKCHLHKNDVVTINANNFDKGYAIIKAIFKHKGNDGHYYSFIYVDWFEDTNKKHEKLNCPIFILWQNDDSQCKIFPLTIVNGIQKTHFIHNCNSKCQNNNHNLENNYYLKNDFFFKVI